MRWSFNTAVADLMSVWVILIDLFLSLEKKFRVLLIQRCWAHEVDTHKSNTPRDLELVVVLLPATLCSEFVIPRRPSFSLSTVEKPNASEMFESGGKYSHQHTISWKKSQPTHVHKLYMVPVKNNDNHASKKLIDEIHPCFLYLFIRRTSRLNIHCSYSNILCFFVGLASYKVSAAWSGCGTDSRNSMDHFPSEFIHYHYI